MFLNLHTLPASQSMYTAAIGTAEDGHLECDEVDFVASRSASLEDLLLAAVDAAAGDYDGQSIVGLINQSDGFVIFQP